MTQNRIPIGVWLETNPGEQWANQGMTRLLGFILEGLVEDGRYQFRLVLPDHIRAEAEADLSTLQARADVDYTLHSPRDEGLQVSDFTELAEFANRHVEVTGWLTLFPQYDHAQYLTAPVTAIFPDAIPLVFPDFSEAAWNERGHHMQWQQRVEQLLQSVERVITFSEHVAYNQVVPLFGVDRTRTRVIRVAPPDLAGFLPHMQNRARSPSSLSQAAAVLRQHAAERGWEYLYDFPFEDVSYVAVSTQDRVTKNIRVVADAVIRLTRDQRIDIRMLMTAPLLLGTKWTPLPMMVEGSQAHREVISMPDLPRPVHAAFYHAAELAVHPSIFEGGMGTFPFYEAVSVGTPCLMADGPHQREMAAQVPEITRYVFDPNDATGLARLITEVKANRTEMLLEQTEIYEKLCARSWNEVALAYARAATENSWPNG